ncbi:MAG: hypothetical protein GX488_01975 [Clostridiales bacterium]|nr:hypothetical protein [Clostridiales bacterium]
MTVEKLIEELRKVYEYYFCSTVVHPSGLNVRMMAKNCADKLEEMKDELAKEQRRAERAVNVLERIKRDINEQDKIYIHIADYFGRGIYIDEEGDAVAYFTLCKDNELGDVYKCASCGNEMYGNMPKYCSECGKRIVEGDAK